MTWTWLGIAASLALVFSFCTGFRRGFVREVVSTFFILLSVVIVWFINPYVNEFLRENTPVYEKIQEGTSELVGSQKGNEKGVDETEQKSFIEGLELPGFLEDGIKENNTAEVYSYLSVNTFADYVSGYLSLVAVNGLSFLVSFFLAMILIQTATCALNLISRLPVINGVNKIAGALMGGVKCVIFIWVALLLLTVFCNTEIGKTGLQMVEKDYVLSFLNENNIFAKIFTSIFYGK